MWLVVATVFAAGGCANKSASGMKMHRSSEHIQNAQCWSGMLGKQSWGNIVDIQSLLEGCSTHAVSWLVLDALCFFVDLSGRQDSAICVVDCAQNHAFVKDQFGRSLEALNLFWCHSSKCCLLVHVEEEVQHPQWLVLGKTSWRSKQQTQTVQ